jgi:glutathione S-transferase
VSLYVQSTRCKVCLSPLREQIDAMLLVETRRPDGNPYRVEDIVAWAAEQGEQLSAGGLSRHRTNHLLPALGAALEAQQVMEAITKATGKQLSLHTAVTNIIAHKTLRLLDAVDFKDIDLKDLPKILNVAVRSAHVATRLELAEKALTKDQAAKVAEQVEKKLESKNLDPETLATIRQEIYGLSQ